MQPIILNSEYYKQILENVNAGVYTTDLKRRIVLWNKGAELITGYKAEEVRGRSCSSSILQHRDKEGRPLCASESCPLHLSMIKNEKSKSGMIVSSLTKSGKRIWVKTRVAPLHDDTGSVIGGIEIFEDVSSEIKDYEKARAIQEKLLGNIFQGMNQLEISHTYVPCEVVGGDLITVDKQEDWLIFSLVDFVGHGLPAALMSSYYKSIVNSALSRNTGVEEILTIINKEFLGVFDEAYIGTAILGAIHSRTGEMVLYNAGHPAPQLIRSTPSGMEVKVLDLPGFPLGVFFEPPQPYSLKLNAGDAIFFTSDGILETRRADNSQLGQRFMASRLIEAGRRSGNELLQTLLESAMQFNKTVEFEDDISMLLIRFKP